MNPFLDKLQKERASLEDTLDGIFTRAAEDDDRTELTDSEDATVTQVRSKIDTLDARIADLSDIELRSANANELAAKVDASAGKTRSNSEGHVRSAVISEESIYRADGGTNGNPSFIRDMVNSYTNRDPESLDRLTRHNASMQRSTTTANLGDPGGFIPPEWLLSNYADLAKAGRPAANLLPNLGAPTTGSMKIPKVTAGLSVGFQTTQNTGLTTSDSAASDIQADVRTLGGYTDVSVQNLTYGSLPDNYFFRELANDYAVQIETMVLGSSTTNNLGLSNITNLTHVAYDDASPTVGELYAKIGYAIANIHNTRYLGPEVIIMDPILAGWIQSSRDTAGRPLVTPLNPQNALATVGSPLAAEGIKFELMGLPVCVSASVPLSGGATPSDRQVFVARISDSILWESAPSAQVFTDVGSATGTVRFRLLSFVAQCNVRQPTGYASVYGSGTSISASNFI